MTLVGLDILEAAIGCLVSYYTGSILLVLPLLLLALIEQGLFDYPELA